MTESTVAGIGESRTGSGETPVIFWASDPIGPGETLMIQGHAFTGDVVVEATPGPAQQLERLEILDKTNQCIKALIPIKWKSDVYGVRVTTAAGSASTLLNRPGDTWWVGDLGDRQTPGGQFRIVGRNMVGDTKAVRVRLTGQGNVDVPVEEAEVYTLTARLPANVPTGQYKLQVHNGRGGDAGWSDPMEFVVEHARKWPQTVFNVKDFGAIGNGMVDDTAAIQAALAKAGSNGGGIVYFPRGRYDVRDTLMVPRFTVLKGDKREWVELLWPNQPKAFVLVRGSNSFGLEDITLAAFNYLDGIESDEGSMATSGDVFLRRIRVRALRYSRLKSMDEVHQRFVDSTPHSEGGCTVLIGGRNIEITDCDLYGSGRGLALTGVRGGRVSGNKIHNGRYGWYTLSGMDGLIFENNEIIGADLMSAGGSLNTFYHSYGCKNLYFANNTIKTVFGSDREGTSSDGGGGNHTGHIDSANGVQLVLSDEPRMIADIWYKEAKPGMGVYILDGRGAGQWRRVVGQQGLTVEIDRPWVVAPDCTSIVSISTFQGNYILVGNDYSDSTCAIQMFGISIGHVIARNTSARAGGFHVWGLCYGSVQPSWYCQMVGNEIVEGNGILGPCNEAPAKDSHIAAMGPPIPGYNSPLVRCVVIRGNHLHNNSCIELIGAVCDAVVEHNTVENANVGINVETKVTGAVLRENRFVNVEWALIRTEKT
jgi:Pectate lyase superfamily protein